MQKIKDFVREYGIYLVIAAVFFGTGYFKARYNLVIVSESKWHDLVESESMVKAMLYEEELKNNLVNME